MTTPGPPPPPSLLSLLPPPPPPPPLSPEQRKYVNDLLDKLDKSTHLGEAFDRAAAILYDKSVDKAALPDDVFKVLRQLHDLREPWDRICRMLDESEEEKKAKRIKQLEAEIASGERAMQSIQRQRQELYMTLKTSEERERDKVKRARSELESLTSTA